MTEQEETLENGGAVTTVRLKLSVAAAVVVVVAIGAFTSGFMSRGLLLEPAEDISGKLVAGGSDDSPAAQESDDVAQLVADLKKEVSCTCGCGLTLERCEIEDPPCNTRPGIISRVEELAKQGKTKEEILNIMQGKPAEPSPQPAPATTRIDVSEDDDPALGPADAPVTIIEFSDYQCPYCNRVETTLKQVFETYGDQVRLVYRDYPLPFHTFAQKAAEAAECAEDQGKFWEFHDKLFENQQSINTENMKQWAKDLGLDSTKFDDCLDSGKYASEVQKDFEDGQAAGVSGTPTFFINGQKLVGAQPFTAFKSIIDGELSK